MSTEFSLATINVDDLDRSLAFYVNVLGLPVSEQFDIGDVRIAMLGEKDSGARVELVQSPEEVPHPKGRGCRYGFVVSDAQPILERLNGECDHPDSPNPVFEFYYTKDPDGYLIEIMEPASAHDE